MAEAAAAKEKAAEAERQFEEAQRALQQAASAEAGLAGERQAGADDCARPRSVDARLRSERQAGTSSQQRRQQLGSDRQMHVEQQLQQQIPEGEAGQPDLDAEAFSKLLTCARLSPSKPAQQMPGNQDIARQSKLQVTH